MNTLAFTPDPMPRYHLMHSFAAHTFAPHPTFQGVAVQLLKAQWLQKYPSINVDVGQLKLAEPVPFPDPFSIEADSEPSRYRYMSVADVMIQSYLDAQPVRLMPGVHHLYTCSDTEDLHLLSVDMAQVQNMINDCSALLMEAYQYALVQYWSEKSTGTVSPFECLKQALQTGLNSIVPDSTQAVELSNEQAPDLTVLVRFPDKADLLQTCEETPLHSNLVAI